MPSGEQSGAVALVRAYVERLEARDWGTLGGLLREDVVYRLPQTGEVVRGREAYLRWNQEYPDGWHLRLAEAYGDASGAAARLDVEFAADTVTALVFFTFDGDLISEIRDWWPTPYEPPAGREHLTERL